MFDAKQYWEDRLKVQYDLVGVGDISLSQNYNKWSYKITRKILAGLLKKYSNEKSNTNVLDIGSGTGFVVDIWKSLGKKVTGVDISGTAVKNLQVHYPTYQFIEFDMGAGPVPLNDNSFSVCSAASVLYHIVDDNALDTTLSNIYRILEREGYFIFSDNFIHNAEYNIVHQKCRTLAEYETALRKNGFEVLGRVPNYVLMNDPVDTRGKFYPRLWSSLTSLSRRSKFADRLIWPALYPIERLLTAVMKESPAQEFMICKAIK